MGRAMLIICAGTLFSLGIISLSTSQRGAQMTQNAVGYASETAAKNAAHTAIQIAMQNMNEDENWADNHGSANPWTPTINNASITLYVEKDDVFDNPDEYWEADSLRIISEAVLENNYESAVTSVYLMAPFSNLVPDFTGALQLPQGYGSLTVDGNAHGINGNAPHCEENKPAIAVNRSETKDGLNSHDLNLDDGAGTIEVDNGLSYEPTDELIERLLNSGNATMVNSDFGDNLGTADNPGVFFIDGDVKLSGSQKEGYGILVIRGTSSFEMEDPTLSVAGNFTFNGLVIFENAELFDGHGTPTINGSVLVGDTEGEVDIDVNIGGNIEINYDCDGENYAKMAAANAVKQNKYSRVVTYE